jgi:hypothetical protein
MEVHREYAARHRVPGFIQALREFSFLLRGEIKVPSPKAKEIGDDTIRAQFLD